MKTVVTGLFLLVSTYSFALDRALNTGPYDVIAPALHGDPSGSDAQTGQIYLDTSTSAGAGGSLKLIGKDGAVQTLSSGSGTGVITTGAQARIERVSFGAASEPSACSVNNGNCTIYRSSSGISSVLHGATNSGIYTINFVSGTFSAPPTCVITATNTSTMVVVTSAPTSTSFSYTVQNTATGAASDHGGHAICMGPS